MVNNEIQSSDLSNCRDQLNILTISSFKTKDPEKIENENDDHDQDTSEITSFRKEVFCTNDNLLNVFQDSTVVRMAAEIEKKIKFVARFECDDCMNVLDDNEKIFSTCHKYAPCLSTVLIGKVVYKFVNLFKNKKNISYKILLECILNNIDDANIFSDFVCGNDHKKYFIDFISQDFIRMQTVYIAKTETLNEQNEMLRKKLRKTVHFSGQ